MKLISITTLLALIGVNAEVHVTFDEFKPEDTSRNLGSAGNRKTKHLTFPEMLSVCDTDLSASLSLQELHDCVTENSIDRVQQLFHSMIDKNFATIDANADGSLDATEL